MKKIFGILALFLLLSSCDDGDMSFQTFNFDGDLLACSTVDDVYLKINGSEVLILDLSSTPLLNIASVDTDGDGEIDPTIIQLSSGKIKYRNYNATASSSTVCSNIDSSSISILEEWLGSGTISITTTTTDNITYSHSITLVDVSFTKGDETLRLLDNYLGERTTSVGFDFDFESDTESPTEFLICTDEDNIYTTGSSSTEALILSFASGTFQNIMDNIGTTTENTIAINTNNVLRLRVFSSTAGSDSFCSITPPLSPTETARWETISTGSVKIVTTQEGNVFTHEMYLQNVVFYNAANSTESYIPVPAEDDTTDYFIGVYITSN